jgi:hypothetical protein
MKPHGTPARYFHHGCRCDQCHKAACEYNRDRLGHGVKVDKAAMRDLLHELFPLGLTDDCPARQSLQQAQAA